MNKKIVIIVAVLVLLLGTGGYMAIQPKTVECIEVQSENYKDVFKEDGKVIANDEAVLYAATNEKVSEINVEEGQIVQKGDVLLRFDHKTLEFQLENLVGQKNALLGQMQSENEKVDPYKLEAQEKQIEIAQSDLDKATNDFEKYKTLYKESAVSKNELDSAEKLYKDANRNLEMQTDILSSLRANNKLTSGSKKQYEGLIQQIDAQIESLQYQIDQCTVIAPMTGIVSEFDIKLGDRVMPQTPILKVFDQSGYKVEAYVLSADASGLKEQSTVQAIKKVKGQELMVNGYIDSIAPTAVTQVSTLGVEEQRVKVIVKFEDDTLASDENLSLRPGEKVDIEFTAYALDNCLVLPKDAVFESPDDQNVDYVWMIKDGKATLQPVEKIYETTRKVVVNGGIQNGDVVVYPLKGVSLDEGMAVKAASIK